MIAWILPLILFALSGAMVWITILEVRDIRNTRALTRQIEERTRQIRAETERIRARRSHP